MHQEAREELEVRFKLVVLELADNFGVAKTCQDFNLPRSTFYRWKKSTTKKDGSDCTEKSPSHIAIRARHIRML